MVRKRKRNLFIQKDDHNLHFILNYNETDANNTPRRRMNPNETSGSEIKKCLSEVKDLSNILLENLTTTNANNLKKIRSKHRCPSLSAKNKSKTPSVAGIIIKKKISLKKNPQVAAESSCSRKKVCAMKQKNLHPKSKTSCKSNNTCLTVSASDTGKLHEKYSRSGKKVNNFSRAIILDLQTKSLPNRILMKYLKDGFFLEEYLLNKNQCNDSELSSLDDKANLIMEDDCNNPIENILSTLLLPLQKNKFGLLFSKYGNVGLFDELPRLEQLFDYDAIFSEQTSDNAYPKKTSLTSEVDVKNISSEVNWLKELENSKCTDADESKDSIAHCVELDSLCSSIVKIEIDDSTEYHKINPLVMASNATNEELINSENSYVSKNESELPLYTSFKVENLSSINNWGNDSGFQQHNESKFFVNESLSTSAQLNPFNKHNLNSEPCSLSSIEIDKRKQTMQNNIVDYRSESIPTAPDSSLSLYPKNKLRALKCRKTSSIPFKLNKRQANISQKQHRAIRENTPKQPVIQGLKTNKTNKNMAHNKHKLRTFCKTNSTPNSKGKRSKIFMQENCRKNSKLVKLSNSPITRSSSLRNAESSKLNLLPPVSASKIDHDRNGTRCYKMPGVVDNERKNNVKELKITEKYTSVKHISEDNLQDRERTIQNFKKFSENISRFVPASESPKLEQCHKGNKTLHSKKIHVEFPVRKSTRCLKKISQFPEIVLQEAKTRKLIIVHDDCPRSILKSKEGKRNRVKKKTVKFSRCLESFYLISSDEDISS